jgi:hypothetical protein
VKSATVGLEDAFLSLLGVNSFDDVVRIGETCREHPELSPVERGAEYMLDILTRKPPRDERDIERRAQLRRLQPLAERHALRAQLADAIDARDDLRVDRLHRALRAWERRFHRLTNELSKE